jgi:hypothetical protein
LGPALGVPTDKEGRDELGKEDRVPATRAARRMAGRVGRQAGRLTARVLVTLATAALVMLAVGDAVGRWKLVPAPAHVAHTKYVSSDLVVVVPVPVQKLKVGDVVIVHNKDESALLRLDQIVDSEGPQVRFAGDPPGRVRRLGGTAWRVSRAVPYAGGVLGLFAGPIQGAVFVLIGIALVARAEWKRSREPIAAPRPPESIAA